MPLLPLDPDAPGTTAKLGWSTMAIPLSIIANININAKITTTGTTQDGIPPIMAGLEDAEDDSAGGCSAMDVPLFFPQKKPKGVGLRGKIFSVILLTKKISPGLTSYHVHTDL
jgi:hypothetical protein